LVFPFSSCPPFGCLSSGGSENNTLFCVVFFGHLSPPRFLAFFFMGKLCRFASPCLCSPFRHQIDLGPFGLSAEVGAFFPFPMKRFFLPPPLRQDRVPSFLPAPLLPPFNGGSTALPGTLVPLCLLRAQGQGFFFSLLFSFPFRQSRRFPPPHRT